MSERAGTVSEPSRCDCRWSEDCPEVPCGCGQEQVRLYRDEAYHWRGLHWRTPCLIAALAAPHPSADPALPPELRGVLGHAFEPSYSDPTLCGFITEGASWVASDPHRCRKLREAHQSSVPLVSPPELREQTDQGDGLLGNAGAGASIGPPSTSRRPSMLPQSFFPSCGCTLDSRNGDRVYICPEHIRALR
jgi:hypothetical protein